MTAQLSNLETKLSNAESFSNGLCVQRKGYEDKVRAGKFSGRKMTFQIKSIGNIERPDEAL